MACELSVYSSIYCIGNYVGLLFFTSWKLRQSLILMVMTISKMFFYAEFDLSSHNRYLNVIDNQNPDKLLCEFGCESLWFKGSMRAFIILIHPISKLLFLVRNQALWKLTKDVVSLTLKYLYLSSLSLHLRSEISFSLMSYKI